MSTATACIQTNYDINKSLYTIYFLSSYILLGAPNSRNNSMKQCQLMLENNEKNNLKILYLRLRFEDVGTQKMLL
jgi:hypothetical protein